MNLNEIEITPATRTIWENEYIQIIADNDEPWRCYVYTDPDRTGKFDSWAGNPRLSEMADMAMAILAEHLAQ